MLSEERIDNMLNFVRDLIADGRLTQGILLTRVLVRGTFGKEITQSKSFAAFALELDEKTLYSELDRIKASEEKLPDNRPSVPKRNFYNKCPTCGR